MASTRVKSTVSLQPVSCLSFRYSSLRETGKSQSMLCSSMTRSCTCLSLAVMHLHVTVLCVCTCVRFSGLKLLFKEKRQRLESRAKGGFSGSFRDLRSVHSPSNPLIFHSWLLSRPMNVILFSKPAPHSYNQG